MNICLDDAGSRRGGARPSASRYEVRRATACGYLRADTKFDEQSVFAVLVPSKSVGLPSDRPQPPGPPSSSCPAPTAIFYLPGPAARADVLCYCLRCLPSVCPMKLCISAPLVSFTANLG
ncbi:uncharacterized protein TRAVEDRAFT_52687 [Trametes versicolor FP-101664 SS1]|uniref:uncharacterized protein n=1 Tax=Trametes versicolor (strain FP-101664) TaxID=717944 RepID=UPI00046246BA|nr:uncharacterized protein TRAVEDRAFT_52687 [Trametes versicolor FP-101664 SS1]EIW53566.1 hypothetical protein TRAVEDRAFT_52687 [Trametes versicolor FP-101664 SS1]